MRIDRCFGCMEQIAGYPCPHCGYVPEGGKSYALRPGTILHGKYLVGKPLGQGGFGISYIGWDLVLDRKVAVKEYYPSGQVSRHAATGNQLEWYDTEQALQAHRGGMEMFLKEARKMTRVSRIDRVVQVLDLFQENDTAYIVMEFVEGQTLMARLRERGILSWQEARAIFIPAIRAMEQVHQAGLIHRDLSPDNLMLEPDGGVKILDLGAAKDLNINSGASSMQVAKKGFSPLEQYTQRGASGPWTDVYAMAATMYYALTGVLPPAAVDRMEEDGLNWDLPRLRQLPPHVTAALRVALAVRAKERTQSMAQLERGLTTGNAAPPTQRVPAAASGERARAGMAPRRRGKLKWVAVAAVAAVMAVAGLTVGLTRARSGPSLSASPEDPDQTVPQTAATQPSTAPTETTAPPSPEELAYAEAERLLAQGDIPRAAIAFGKLGDHEDARERSLDCWSQVDGVKTVSATLGTVAAVRNDGTVVAAGDNEYVRCNVDGWTDIVSIRANYDSSTALTSSSSHWYGGDHSFIVGLKSDGTVVATGDNTCGQCDVGGWTDIVSIITGDGYTVGLKADGTVVAVGNNEDGQCDVDEWSDIISIEGVWHRTAGLKSDGTVVATGYSQSDQRRLSEWTDVVKISAGANHIAGLKADGTVVAVGDNVYGQCNVGGWKDIVDIGTGSLHTVGLKADGTVVAVGTNSEVYNGFNSVGRCEVHGWSDIVAISVADLHTVGLKSDGTVVAVGNNYMDKCNVSDWTDVIAICTDYGTVGLRADGTVVAVGIVGIVDDELDVSGFTDIRLPG